MGSHYQLLSGPSSYYNKDESRASFSTGSPVRLAGAQTQRAELLRKVRFTPVKKYMLSRHRPPYAPGLTADYAMSKDTTDFGDVPDSLMQFYHPLSEQIMQRRLYMENQSKLVEMRVVYATKRTDLNQQWQQLHRDEIQLRKSFLRFNEFVKQNLEKRERAEKKTGEDIILKIKRIAEVEKIKVEVQRIQAATKILDKVIRQHRIFEDFLTTVARCDQARGQFKTVDDLLSKYETMISAKNKLATEQERMLGELEGIKQRLTKLIAASRLAMLGLINRKCDLSHRFNATLRIAKEQESLVEKIKVSSMNTFAQITGTKLSIYNLYLNMCNRTNIAPHIEPGDYESILVFIKKSCVETMRAKKLLKQTIINHHRFVYRE